MVTTPSGVYYDITHSTVDTSALSLVDRLDPGIVSIQPLQNVATSVISVIICISQVDRSNQGIASKPHINVSPVVVPATGIIEFDNSLFERPPVRSES